VVAKLQANAEYRACSPRPSAVTAGQRGKLGRAIAAFERTLLANNSPFDRYMRATTAP